MQMAKDSRQQGWWHAFGDIPYSVYIGLETEAATPAGLRTPDHHRPVADPALRRRPSSRARLPETSAADRWRNGCRSAYGGQERISDRPQPAAAVGGPRRGVPAPGGGRQAGDAGAAGARRRDVASCRTSPCRCCPSTSARTPASTASTPSWSSPTRPTPAVVYIEGVTSDLYLEKAPDVQKYTVMYEHLRAQALNVEQSRQRIEDVAKEYAR